MDKDEILALIDGLDPGDHYVSQALSFLRLVVKNNPQKTPDDLLKRKDVQQALGIIDAWTVKAREAATAVTAASPLPASATEEILEDIDRTLDKLVDDTRLTDDHLAEWAETDPADWAAKLILRMTWLKEWLAKLAGTLLGGAPYKRWVSMLAPNTCRFCRALHGVTIPMGSSFAPYALAAGMKRIYGGLYAPPSHPRCLPGGTPVAALAISGVTERVFVGELVTLGIGGQQDLSITPNHPVLTDHGWVPAGLLKVGDKVVSTSWQEGPLSGEYQDDQDVPAPIQQVAESFLGSGLVSSGEVVVAPEDFHGDTANGEVAVVGAYRGLLRVLEATLGEPACEHVLAQADVGVLDRPRTSYGLSVFRRLLLSANRAIGGSSDGPSLFVGSSGEAEALRLADASGLHSVLGEDTADDVTTDAVALRKRLLSLSGAVTLQEVTDVRRNPFAGDVYNLQTADGWYIASGVIVHNCQCTLEPVSQSEYDSLQA